MQLQEAKTCHLEQTAVISLLKCTPFRFTNSESLWVTVKQTRENKSVEATSKAKIRQSCVTIYVTD